MIWKLQMWKIQGVSLRLSFKKTTVRSLFLSWQVYSLDTPILGKECEELLTLTILASFDTISSHENGIFTNQKKIANS